MIHEENANVASVETTNYNDEQDQKGNRKVYKIDFCINLTDIPGFKYINRIWHRASPVVNEGITAVSWQIQTS